MTIGCDDAKYYYWDFNDRSDLPNSLIYSENFRPRRLEIFSCGKMRRQRSLNDHDLVAVIFMDHRQEENHVLVHHVARNDKSKRRISP